MPVIEVAHDDWGDSQIADIERLLVNVAAHFDRCLCSPHPSGHIIVRRRVDGPPLISYRNHDSDPHIIYLPAANRLWSQFSYQFAHEYFHFLSGYERLRDSKHKWFEEVLGEMASLYALRQMSISWRIAPPYPNWFEYSASLASYASDACSRPSRQLPHGRTFAEHFAQFVPSLIADPYQRELNGVFAVALLPIFEADSAYWELVRCIPFGKGSFFELLSNWHEAAPTHLRVGVNQIGSVFGWTNEDTLTSES